MRGLLSLLFVTLFAFKGFSQDASAAFMLTISKSAWVNTYFIEEQSSLLFTHLDDDMCVFTRLSLNFEISDQDFITDLRKYKINRIIGVRHDFKNTDIFYAARDSSTVKILRYNRISDKLRRINTQVDLKYSSILFATQVENSYCLAVHSLQDKKTKLFQINADQDAFEAVNLEFPFLKEWMKEIENNPFPGVQSVSSIHSGVPHQASSKCKLYPFNNELIISYDHPYTTDLIKINIGNHAIKYFTYPIEIHNKGSLSGARSNSIIIDDKLFQFLLNEQGITIQQSGIDFQKTITNQYLAFAQQKELFSYSKEKKDEFNYSFDKNIDQITFSENFSIFGIGCKRIGQALHFNLCLSDYIQPDQELVPFLTNPSAPTDKLRIQNNVIQNSDQFAFNLADGTNSQSVYFVFDERTQSIVEKDPFMNDWVAQIKTLEQKISKSVSNIGQKTFFLLKNDCYFCFYRRNEHQFYISRL